MLQTMKEIANIWEYKVGNNVNIANLCVCENIDYYILNKVTNL